LTIHETFSHYNISPTLAWLNGNPYPCGMSCLFLIIRMKFIWCKDIKGKEMIQYLKIGIL
ncbi:hypothetical protein, partial [Prevotella pallens]|uniref:hypothetical protein n=1 Tax=Prevotella pallens TaxID=60133 RepID=UPI003C73DCAA